MLFIEGQAAFYGKSFLRYGSYWFLDKKYKYKKTLKIFSSKNKSFHNLHKVAVLNTIVVDLWYNIFKKSYKLEPININNV